ncbi:MAG: hypothetical protein ABIC57_01955 [bacterium]
MPEDTGTGTGTSITTPAISMEGIPYFSSVWVFDNSTGVYVDHTIESQRVDGTVFSILEDANDYLYLGSESRFDMSVYILASVGSVGALTHAYSRADNTWTQTIPIEQWDTSSDYINYDFTMNGAEEYRTFRNWSARSFSAVSPHAVTPPDTISRYWLRISVASVSVAPTVNQIQMRPYAVYCTPSDVAKQLELNFDFSATTTPTRETVEDYIYAAQSIIDYRTHKSWRVKYKQNESHEFNIAGIRLMERDVRRVTQLKVWNGGGWDTKEQGRTNDYFLTNELGMLYFSRYFLLPARMASYNAPVWRWGWGEFTYPVQISYLFGRDINGDREQGGMVWDLAKKMASVDVLQNHDYSILAVSGSDKVTMDRKIENWKIEIEEKLESLISWVMI